MKRMLFVLTALILISSTASARDTWLDNFDSYSTGPLIEQSVWEGWEYNLAFDARVVSGIALSAPNSLEILPTSDVVAVFSGATSGQWIVSGWCYIPCNATGAQFWIMLNTYDPPNFNWSVQVQFNSDTGLVGDDGGLGSTPIICDTWIEVRSEIDLDTNSQTFYYNGLQVYTDTWTGHMPPEGIPQIAALDLYSQGGSSIYWDDIVIEGPSVIPTEHTSWGEVKNLYK